MKNYHWLFVVFALFTSMAGPVYAGPPTISLMPALNLPDKDVVDITAYLSSLR